MSEKKKSSNSDSEENSKFYDGVKVTLDSAILGTESYLGKIYDVKGSIIDNMVDRISSPLYKNNLMIESENISSNSLTFINANSAISLHAASQNISSINGYINSNTVFEFKDPNKYIAAGSLATDTCLKSGIFDAHLPTSYTNTFLSSPNQIDSMNIKDGVFAIETLNQKTESLIFGNQKHDNLFLVRDGILEQSPTNRLINGSVDYLSLTNTNKISLNDSFCSHMGTSETIMGLTNVAKTVLGNTDWNKVGNAYNVDLLGKSILQDNILDLSNDYIKLYSKENESYIFDSLPATFTRLTGREYLNNSLLLHSTYIPEIEKVTIADEENSDSYNVLIKYLDELKPDLKNLYFGAIEALDSTNIDRIRHYSTSLRELFTHVIHMLSPDDEIKKWSNDSNHFVKNKPTRKARLLYITRKLNSRNFNNFIESDIKSTIDFINLFQEGTHSVAPSYSESQLNIMKTKMEGTLIYLIEASKLN